MSFPKPFSAALLILGFALNASAQTTPCIPTGQPIREGPQQTAATVHTLPMLAQGVQGRAK